MKYKVITNNPKVLEMCEKSKFNQLTEVIFLEADDYLPVLERARAYIHENHELLTHPLSGSIKPCETPFKSLLVSDKKLTKCHFESVQIIEESVATFLKFKKDARPRKYTEQHLSDFMTIDLHIIRSGIESAEAVGC